MSLAIDGLVSGLDTTALINSLMQLEAVPQTLLKSKVTASQAYISALQGLNTRVAALGELAVTTTKPQALDLYSTTSSSDKVTATATTGAQAGEIDLVVGQLAQAQKSVTAAMSVWADDPPVLTIVGSDGTQTQVTAASTSLDAVVTAINAAGAGVTATKVSVGGGEFRLQVSSTETGAAGAFSVHRDTAAGADIFAETGAATVRTAANAEVTLWAGSAASQTISSPTNTFASLMPGVSITVAAASVTPVTIGIARDDARIADVAARLVTGLNDIFALISSKSAVTTGTSSTGATTVSGGAFAGDSTVRDVNRRIMAAASQPIDGRSPSEFGIVITKSGTLEFNAEKFAAALAKDPAATQAALQTIAGRVGDAARVISDKYDGLLTGRITGQQSSLRDLSDRISDWDIRLTTRRSTLERTYSALEVQLSSLNAQSSYLSSQLASLSGSSTSQ